MASWKLIEVFELRIAMALHFLEFVIISIWINLALGLKNPPPKGLGTNRNFEYRFQFSGGCKLCCASQEHARRTTRNGIVKAFRDTQEPLQSIHLVQEKVKVLKEDKGRLEDAKQMLLVTDKTLVALMKAKAQGANERYNEKMERLEKRKDLYQERTKTLPKKIDSFNNKIDEYLVDSVGRHF